MIVALSSFCLFPKRKKERKKENNHSKTCQIKGGKKEEGKILDK